MFVIKSKVAVIIYVCVVFIFSGCAGNAKLKNEVLLEVTVKTSGQVSFQGEKLLLRVFENRDAEADILSSRTQKETKFQREKISFSDNDYQEIRQLLKLIESVDVKKKYSPNAPSSDLYSVTMIKFTGVKNQKIEIILEEYATGVLIDEYGEKYPKPLSDLLRKIYKLRQ